VIASAGYSGTPLPRKLGIKPGMRVALLHAPEGIEHLVVPLPDDVTIQHGLRRSDRVDLVVAFVTERDHLARNIGWVLGTLPDDGTCWVAWPKRASKVETDMNEHVVREIVLPLGWVDTKVCAIDDTWTGFKIVLRLEHRGQRPAPPGRR
jgi:hypothetical protein